ncbi:MAG TPA: hypothetical protein VHR36_01585 [Pyrinomonadaceae bacterium]|nr:hypothetical protein [Pyrinomonadaceae bacterium]
MSIRQRKSMKAIAVFVAFAVAQISIQMSFASTVSPSYAMLVQQQLIVRVSTSGNRPILVNGNSTASGGSLATGAIIETPDGVSATIDLGPLGTLDIAPNSKVVLDFDCPPAPPTPPPAGTEPEPCKVKVKVLAGCVVMKTKKGTQGQIDTEQQEKVQESNKKGGGAPLNFCTPGAAAAGPAAAAAATAGGIGTGTIVAGVVAAGLLIGGLVVGFSGGSNPSPGTP